MLGDYYLTLDGDERATQAIRQLCSSFARHVQASIMAEISPPISSQVILDTLLLCRFYQFGGYENGSQIGSALLAMILTLLRSTDLFDTQHCRVPATVTSLEDLAALWEGWLVAEGAIRVAHGFIALDTLNTLCRGERSSRTFSILACKLRLPMKDAWEAPCAAAWLQAVKKAGQTENLPVQLEKCMQL